MAAMFVAKNAIFTLPKAFPFPAVPSALPLRAPPRVSRVCFCSSSASKPSHQQISDRDPRRDSRADMAYRSRETMMGMDEVKGTAKEATEAAKQRAGQMKEKAKDNAERMKDETKSTAEILADKARASKEMAKERANQTMEKTAETGGTTAENAKKTAHSTKEKAEEVSESAVEKAKKGTDKVAETVQNLGEKAKGTVKDAFGAAKETTHKIKEKLAGTSSSEDEADPLDEETKRMGKSNKLY